MQKSVSSVAPLRQWLVVLAIIAITVNAPANILPIAGRQKGVQGWAVHPRVCGEYSVLS